jgi:hypothetical protein
MEHFHLIPENGEIDAVDVSPPAKKKQPHRALSGGEFRNNDATLAKL